MSPPTDHDLLVRIDERVDQMHKALYGNGQPGLLMNFATLQAEVDEVRSVVPTRAEKRTVAGGMLTLVLFVVALAAKVLGVTIPVQGT